MNILIVNPFGIGDCLFTTPLIHSLKDKFPKHKLGFLCNRRVEPLLRNNPFLDEIIIYERDDFKRFQEISRLRWLKEFNAFIGKIRKSGFDLAVDLSLAAHFGFFLWLAGVKKRIGYNYKGRGFYLTGSLKLSGYEDMHVIEYYNRLLEFIGVEAGYNAPELFLNKNDEIYAEALLEKENIGQSQAVIAIAPGGGASWGVEAKIKRWPREKFSALANKIIEKHDVKIIILGDDKERDLISDIESRFKDKVINLSGQTTLPQSAALINKSILFIGNDGGLLHMAVALRKKTVSFFGPVDPKVYGPYPPDSRRHIVLKRQLECSPCYRGFRLNPCGKKRECLESIKEDDVFSAIDKTMGSE